MRDFIGREKELLRLESIWSGDGNKAVAVYGRRRIGKSELLRRFCSDKRSLYIECVIGSIRDNIHSIYRVLCPLNGVCSEEPSFLKDVLDGILECCRTERTVVVFDEIPYLLESAEHAGSLMQHLVDGIVRETDSMIVICGSSMSVMNRETTMYDRPLYGRFPERMEVGAMSFDECRRFHPNMDDLDVLKLYLSVGGIPKFHLDRETGTYREYIEKHFLSPDSDMSDDGEVLIAAEFSPMGRYMAIINAVMDGATTQKTISEKSGVQRIMCSRCIEELLSVGILGVVNPMMGSPKRPVYRVLDPMIAFSQGVVRESKAFLMNDPSEIYDAISSRIDTFLGIRFEDFCSDYVRSHWSCTGLGRWWGPDDEGTVREVDIVARVGDGDSSYGLFGECKFRKRSMSASVYKELMDDASLIRTDLNRRYVLFSISGFTDELKDIAERDGVFLVGPDELLGRRSPLRGAPTRTVIIRRAF